MVFIGLIIPWLKDSMISWNYRNDGIAVNDKDCQVVRNITTSLMIWGDNNYRSILLNLLLIFSLPFPGLLTYWKELKNAKLAFSEFCTNNKTYVVHDLILCTLKFTNAYHDICCKTSGSSCNLYLSLKALTECTSEYPLVLQHI
jgi:hypothetical protein